MTDLRGPCAVCTRPIRWYWPLGIFVHENPNVRNHSARPVPAPPTPSRPCGCPDYSVPVAP